MLVAWSGIRIVACSLALFMGLVLTSAISAAPSQEELSDPFESWNRKVFIFNETLDEYVARPVAVIYDSYMPGLVTAGVSNFFGNLSDFGTIVNQLLQLKFFNAASDTGRVLVNSTVGLVGLIDVAAHIGLEKHDEDFGQTLAYWNVPVGPYLMLPVLGPATTRGIFGRIPDTYLSPIGLEHVAEDETAQWGLRVLSAVDSRAALLEQEDLVVGDKYTFIRTVFWQDRQFKILDGEILALEDEFDDF